MRSRKTTNILLVLAFLFILTIIILCLLPSDKEPSDTPYHRKFGENESDRTTSRIKATTPTTTPTTTTTTIESTRATLPDETSTTEHYTPSTSEHHTPSTSEYHTPSTTEHYKHPSTKLEETTSTEKTTTEKYLPSTTVEEEETSFSSTSNTTQTLTTLPKYIAETTTKQPQHEETESYNETSIIYESNTETTHELPEDSTVSYTSIPSTTPTTSPTTTSSTTTTTPTTTFTSSVTTTTPSTTDIPLTTPYDHVFILYTEPEGVCASDGCKDMSGKMLDSIDHETDPCENFHEYSCGGVHKDDFLKPENAEETLDNILKEQLVSHDTDALRFYDSCLTYLDGSEGLKHEEVFHPDWKVDLPKSEITNWPSEHLTKTISSLIKRDLPILFDVAVEVRKLNGIIKVLPKLKISLLDDYEDHYDHKYCIQQFHRRMKKFSNKQEEEDASVIMVGNYEKTRKPDDGKRKPENQTGAETENLQKNSIPEEELIDININEEYHQYMECMNSTGLDLRMNHLESVLMESDLFAKGLKPLEKRAQIEKVRAFLMDLNGILLIPPAKHGDGTPFEITTLGEIVGNTILGGLIKWDYLMEDLHGFKLDESQEIVIESLEKFSRIFSYFKEQWNDKNLENVLLMLAGEKLFKKGEDPDYKNDFCFKLTKKYLPLYMQLLFTKSFSEMDLKKLISEIHNLGRKVPVEIAKRSEIYYYVPTDVEFIDENTLKSNIEFMKSELNLAGDFLEDLQLLQTKYRKNMYNVTGTELEDPESCRKLPRDVQIPCNLHTDNIIVPLEQLVAPNFLFRKDMPDYLRLAGVTYYMSKMMALKHGTDGLNLKNYRKNKCLVENIPNKYEERKSNLRITYEINLSEEMKSETLLEFQAFNLAWRIIKNLPFKTSTLELNETKELPLIWLGSNGLPPMKAFLIRKAQESCNQDNKFDLLRISQFKSPPKFFWINSLIKINTLYGSAWHCPANSSMGETRECLPERTTSDWFNPHTPRTPM